MKPIDTIQTALEAYVQECPSEAKVLFTKIRKPYEIPYEMPNSKIIEGNLEVELNDYGNIFYRIDGEWYRSREIEILTRF